MADVAQGHQPVTEAVVEETEKARDTYREMWLDVTRERDRYRKALEQIAAGSGKSVAVQIITEQVAIARAALDPEAR